jgi:hypothetical protein
MSRPGHPRDSGRAAAGGRGARRWVRPLRPSGVVVRGPPRGPVGAGRRDVVGQHRHGLPRLPSADPPRGLGREARRRAAGVLPAAVDRPAPPPPPPTTPSGLRSRRLGDRPRSSARRRPRAQLSRSRTAPVLIGAGRPPVGVDQNGAVSRRCRQSASSPVPPRRSALVTTRSVASAERVVQAKRGRSAAPRSVAGRRRAQPRVPGGADARRSVPTPVGGVGRCLQRRWRRVASSWRISSPTRPPPSGAVG